MSGNPSVADTYVPQFELRPVEDRPMMNEEVRPMPTSSNYRLGNAHAQYVLGDQEDCVICGGRDRKVDVVRGNSAYLLIFLIIELVLGIICLAIEAHFEVATLFIRYYSYHYLERNMRRHLCSARLLYGTTTAMPVFILALLITLCVSGKKTRFGVLIIIIAFVGFVVYIATGIVSFSFPKNDEWVSNTGKLLFEIFAIVTGVVYLIHLIYEIFRK